ncbi:MAG: YicC family protein [Candidatus Delongbacteria bacterium]|nr:YicC family protein [Candidatus Delongbacteria bacterium]
MIYSMTGYGSAEHTSPGIHFKFDIKSVNQKQLELSGTIPIFLQSYDLEIRQIISSQIKRGKVNYYLKVIYWERPSEIFFNRDRLSGIIGQLNQMESVIGTPIRIDLQSLLQIPEVMVINDQEIPDQQALNLIRPVVEQAVNRLLESRLKEGRFILKDIEHSLEQIERILGSILEMKTEAGQYLQSSLEEKLKRILSDPESDQQRVYQEIAYLVDKADIQEEIIRLQSHIQQFHETVNHQKTPGKALNFLIQEMARESNTLGVKCGYLPLIKLNLTLKEEIEKIKEQIQNVE